MTLLLPALDHASLQIDKDRVDQVSTMTRQPCTITRPQFFIEGVDNGIWDEMGTRFEFYAIQMREDEVGLSHEDD